MGAKKGQANRRWCYSLHRRCPFIIMNAELDQRKESGSLEANLSEELRSLLKAEGSISDFVRALEDILVEPESQCGDEEQGSDDPVAMQTEAAAEVKRINATKDLGDVLGGGTLEEQRRRFKRIARLLHPDKGVLGYDTDADNALRKAFAARKQMRGS